MKRIEVLAGISFAIGYSLLIFEIPGGATLVFVSLLSLSLLYLLFSHFIFLDITLVSLFRKSRQKRIPLYKVLINIISGFALSFTFIGILCKIFAWENTEPYLKYGIWSLIIALLVTTIVSHYKGMELHLMSIIYRLTAFAIIGLLFMKT